MAYILYLDKTNDFNCEAQVKGASLNNSIARMVLKSEQLNYIFDGFIDGNNINIPIRKLDGLLDENTNGSMFLECIIDDSYFKPWEDTFTVQYHTKLDITPVMASQPKIEVTIKKEEETLICQESGKEPTEETQTVPEIILPKKDPVKDIQYLTTKIFASASKPAKKKQMVQQVIEKYFNDNPEFKDNIKSITDNVLGSIK